MKISKLDVDKMIKEEFQRMMGKKKLNSRLSQINEELQKMDSEDSELDEVEASGMQKTKSATGLIPGEQPNPKFQHLNPDTIKEDEMDSEEMNIEMGEFEAKFAEIGRAIDAKMKSEAGEEMETGEEAAGEEIEAAAGEEMEAEAGDDDFEEVEVSDEEAEESDENEIDEYKEIVGGVGAEQGMTADQAVKESVDEPLEGESVAQMTDVDSVNDNMEKDTHVNEGTSKKNTVIVESKTPSEKNIFTEGLDQKRKSAMLVEFNKMKKFAGLSNDEE